MGRPLLAALHILPFFLWGSMLLGQCCDHVLVMHDSYGDGWNGGTLQVSINGAVIGSFAATGSGSTSTFTACTGDGIQLIYTPQDWEEENSYTLLNQWGATLFADGPGPATGLVFSGSIDCSVVPAPGASPCTALAIDTADCIIVDNAGAAGTGINPGCANYQGGDLWYSMPVPASGNVSVSTFDAGGLNDTGVALWTGPDCFSLANHACDDDAGEGYFSIATAYELPAGETLYVQVFGYGGATGAFELCVADLGTISLDSTELPIVLINTQGQAIPFDGKVNALMEIKYNGPGNITHITDPSNVYDGRIGIGIRGATSSGYPQRPYVLETRDTSGANLNVSLLGMPEENDWLLLSNYNDRSLVRNELAFHLARSMGQYAPRTHLCEVLVDSSYKGIYVFGEKIKRDGGRVDIARLTGDENSGDDATGGYILQQNLWNSSNSFQSNYSPIDHPGFDVHFVYEYPDPDTITAPQKDYIAAFVDSLETALYATDFADPITGYRRFLDVPSFINYFLVNEVARNADGFKKSVFFHKDKFSSGGKLKAGPVWDFDWAWKNIWGCSICDPIDGSGWTHLVNDCFTDNYSTGWYIRLLQDSTFANELRCTYEEYRTTALSEGGIFAYIDSVGARVQNAQARHFQKWPILGVSGPAPEVLSCATTYAAELDTLKHWIALRLQWLDANIPGSCINTRIAGQPTTRGLAVSPVPAHDILRIIGDGTVTSYRIMSLTGAVLQEGRPQHGSIRVDALPAGMHLLELTDDDGNRASFRIITE
ncbi:MAG: CotH kinase family protein [Flavobacteriales bacterium]|nr:CotH kinase family protein [Flavobacteriales bacterium]